MANYTVTFVVVFIINFIATFRSSSYWDKYKHYFGSKPSASEENKKEGEKLLSSDDRKEEADLKSKHSKLIKTYLAVYLLAALSDWLQGPYVYALYNAYGYSQHLIAILFVAGFGSSMVFGSFIGGLADSCGRRKFTILFALIYALSCFTKHFKDFSILMIGRVLGGIATSLLFSVFDSWLIRSHADRGVSSLLSASFSAASYGNSIMAIFSGLISNIIAESNDLVPLFGDDAKVEAAKSDRMVFVGGFLNPFDMAFVVLALCGVAAYYLWDENYGDTDNKEAQDDDAKPKPWYHSFVSAYHTTVNSKQILYCGIISSLFEGSMYIFVFMWTPALINLTPTKNEGDDVDLPFGLIFSTFMVCCMAGSSTFSIISRNIRSEAFAVNVFLLATAAFTIMSVATSDTFTLIGFILFEFCVGLYFPIMGTLKSTIVPEDQRAAIYNLYRIPLNFIVLFSLLTKKEDSEKKAFMLCMCMMATATYLQKKLSTLPLTANAVVVKQSKPSSDVDADVAERGLASVDSMDDKEN